MRITRHLAHYLAAASLCCACAAAFSDDVPTGKNGELAPGHSSHGEAFDEGPRQAAYLMEGTGKVHLPITTKNEQAQKFFDQGVGQLHGFWYFEAERSFRQVAALDPDCAMAYWGMSMANVGTDKRAKEFIKEAVKREKSASARERMWIDGLDAFYNSTEKDEKVRRQKHIESLEAIVKDYPDELEAKAFLIWRTYDSRGKVSSVNNKTIDGLIDEVLKVEPMHPVHHYRIHIWDGAANATKALASAGRNGQSSPTVAHMWHMPGHTYSSLRMYEDATFHQEASARADHAQMIRDHVMPYQIHNYAHNNEWCTRDLSYIGRVHDAIELAKNMVELPRHPKYNAPERNGSASTMGRDRLYDLLALHELWDEFLTLADTVYMTDASETPEQKVRRLRYLGVAYAAKGNKEQSAKQIAALETMRKEAAKQPATQPATKPAAASVAVAGRGESKPSVAVSGRGESKPAEDGRAPTTRPAGPSSRPTATAGRGGRGGNNPPNNTNALVGQIDKAIAHVRGRQAAAAGDFKTAIAQYDKAGDLRKEHLSQVQLSAGNKDRAMQLAKEAVTSAKDQCYPLANQIDVLFRCDKTKEAEEAFGQLRKLASKIELTVPVYAALAPAAKKFGYPEDWRLPHDLPKDAQARPDLDTLGPFRWHPSPAPTWALHTADGKQVSLADYRGKPVLVVFYLGYGCLHCVEQLNAFAPMTKEFEKAGVSIVAVSTDSVAGLSKSMETSKSEGGYPFPLVSNEQLDIFKAYRVYDDFEKTPLHGTFLIDGQGMVRWQDISYQPFTDTKFLLPEVKRLLAQPQDAAAQ